MALLGQEDMRFKRNHRSAARSNCHILNTVFCLCLSLLAPSHVQMFKQPWAWAESQNSFVWLVLLDQSTLQFWFPLRRYGWLNPRRGRMLEITAHPDSLTKAGGGEDHNEKEILLLQQPHNNWGCHKVIFTTLFHMDVKGCDLCCDD